MHAFQNQMRMAAEGVLQGVARTRIGTVSGFDPNTFMAKILLQPENVETGWLPVGSPWVGSGWGMFAPPSIGDMVEVEFQDGSMDAGMVCQRFYTDAARPLPVPSGEMWMVHKSGTLIKFHNDGSMEIVAAAGISYTATSHTFHGPVTMDQTLMAAGNVTSGANIQATGNISDQGGTKTMSGMRAVFNGHNGHNFPGSTPSSTM